jgi:hypothetical protein
VIVGTGEIDRIHAKTGDDVVCAGGANDLVEAAGGLTASSARPATTR